MKFRSEIYPQLQVRRRAGGYLRFIDGELEVSDKDDVAQLKNLPEDRGVKAVGGRPSKAETKGADEQAESSDEK